MKIRKARKSDLRDYVMLRKLGTEEYAKLRKKKINLPDHHFKRRFREVISSPKRFLFFAEYNKEIVGYLTASLIKSLNQKIGYVDDLFVRKNERKEGVGNLLIKEFINTLKKKKFKKIRLGVYIDNKKALGLYKKLGFKITDYEMEKKLK